jgi:hypothetical protein
MSVWHQAADHNPSLVGSQGELLRVRIAVGWRDLEDLLEELASAPFPLNPEIRHGSPLTHVEFPVYSTQVDEVRALVRAHAVEFDVRDIWEELSSAVAV